MKTLRQLIIIAVFSLAVNYASAQADGKVKMKLNYNVGLPVGDFKKDYISDPSFNGASGEIFYSINPKVAVGLNIGYQSYYQKYGRQTYKTGDNETISAVLSNTVELMPVMLNGTFTPLANSTSRVQPYVSVGAGLNLVNYRQYYGEFSDGNASTSFGAQAGAGITVPLGKTRTNSFQLGATYNHTPYNANELKNLSSVGIQAGIVFPLK
ncbi:MAG TPA: outer membrane beta-barrel protein [Segetibacter sp.]|jgi:hypothetical protein